MTKQAIINLEDQSLFHWFDIFSTPYPYYDSRINNPENDDEDEDEDFDDDDYYDEDDDYEDDD